MRESAGARRRSAVAAVVAMLLAGCGTAGVGPADPAPTSADPTTAGPTVTGTGSTPAPGSAPPSPSPSSGSPTAARPRVDTSGPSFGVDRIPWPATAAGAHDLMQALPQTLRGKPLQLDFQPGEEEFGAEASAEYADLASLAVADEYVTRDTESGKPELLRAGDLLAAQFGLGFRCAKDSYEGTIKPLDGGQGPRPGRSGRSPSSPWFSCTIDAAEGDEDFTGYAVGWTTKKAAWLLVATDEKVARAMIDTLVPPER